MKDLFYGSYHWELRPVFDRISLLNALKVFCSDDTNIFIESVSPSLVRRFQFWRMRSHYRVNLSPDMLFPRPTTFHILLTESNLESLKKIVTLDGMNERSIAHIKGYRGEHGLFWLHGFCDEGDNTLSCSCHVDDATIQLLESSLGLKAEKRFGELKSNREKKDDLQKLLHAMDRIRDAREEQSEPSSSDQR